MKHIRGRKPQADDWLTDKGLTLLQGWARQGLSNEQISNNIGIHESTFYRWQSMYSDIREAIKKGKEVVDFEVENALLKRALGYEKEKTRTYLKDDGTGQKKKHVEVTKEHVPPDPTAMIFWLKNRKPNEWNDKQNINHTGNINYRPDFSNITTDELKRIANGGGTNEKGT
ncbi:helix-turn-helix domain-containing protein [Staphylococcus arlettae]|uniref:helix-turn-helix domain-containing protein n=1 Tax=Staphylococcus arlettae TaxID=29378 RepID=UPI00387A7BD5